MNGELLTAAIIGTRTTPVHVPALPEALEELATCSTADGPEAQLLDLWGSCLLYRRCGMRAEMGRTLPPRSLTDGWKECSLRAVELLAEAMDAGRWKLVSEWLNRAIDVRRRAPHAFLPRLLELTTGHRELQRPVAALAGERGLWLAQFQPHWIFVEQRTTVADDAWYTGSKDQRGEVLVSVRQRDAARGRALVEETWQSDPADQRVEWLKRLRPELSADDEDFLERCLDDRSTRVREEAAQLLARLPSSAFSRRMVERAKAHLHFRPGGTGNLWKLKLGPRPAWDVQLPSVCDAAMVRDGIREKPPTAVGERQWWLLQLLGYTPLAHWSQSYGVSPQTLLDALPEDFADLMRRGWMTSLGRFPEAEWVLPLVQSMPEPRKLPVEVLHAVPETLRPAVMLAQRAAHPRPYELLADWSAAWSPWSVELSRCVVRQTTIPELVMSETMHEVHVAALDEYQARLAGQAESPQWGKAVSTALAVTTWRQQLRKELC